MPITKSAKKALRQTERRTLRNLKRREAYRRLLRDIRKHLSAGRTAEAASLIPPAYRALDKAAKTGVLKPNAAARRKSRLMRWLRTDRPSA